MNVKEALQVLDNAAANGSDDLKGVLSGEYQHLKKSVLGGWEKVKHAKGVAVDYSVDKAEMLDKSVHESPWYFIGGAALLAGGIGFLLGRSMK